MTCKQSLVDPNDKVLSMGSEFNRTEVFSVSPERPPHSFASYDTQGMWRIYSNLDHQGSPFNHLRDAREI
jgi:hypothetical protein